MRTRLIFGAVLAGLLAACNTPSVPLPPPDLPSLSFIPGMAVGTVDLQGKPSSRHANVRFAAFNRWRKVGVLVDAMADGSFTTEPFSGTVGDPVELFYEIAGRRSDSSVCTLALSRALDSTICQ